MSILTSQTGILGAALTLLRLLNQVVVGCQHETALYGRLLRNYDRHSRPTTSSADPVIVRMSFSLTDILRLDEANGQLTVKSWMTLNWVDSYLSWNPEENGGIRRMNFETTAASTAAIWTPDVVLLNGLKSEYTDDGGGGGNRQQAVGYADGQVFWVRPVVFTVSCRHEFRGNAWIAVFRFGSWTYDVRLVDLQPIDAKDNKVDIDADSFSSGDQWVLLDHAGQRMVSAFYCCPDPYVSLEYVVKMRKKVGPSLLGK